MNACTSFTSVSSLKPRLRRLSVLHLLFSLLMVFSFVPRITASQTVSASKTCNGPNPATISGTTTFTITTAPQIIAWSASYGLDQSCGGQRFYIHKDPSNNLEIPLTTTGQTSGLHTIQSTGLYTISVASSQMGGGSYGIIFDRTAAIDVSPATKNFGSELENDSSAKQTFNISKAGDLDVNSLTVTVEGADASFFSLSDLPASNNTAPATFKVRFDAGSIAGNQNQVVRSATLRIKGTSTPVGTTVADKLIMISGTTLKRVPDVKFVGTTPSVIKANHVAGETKDFDVVFKNIGTKDLVFTAPVQLINDNPQNVFSVVTAAALTPLAPTSTRKEVVRFAPPLTASQDQSFAGHLIVATNDPDEPVLICNFTATAHEPRPIIRVEPVGNVINYHDVEIGFSYDQAIIVHNDGDAPLVFNITDTTPADPDHAHWSLLSTPIGVTVPPAGLSAQIQRFTPTAIGGPFDLTLSVVGTNHPSLPPAVNVLLTGKGIAPIPINSVLVLDRSGSMADSAGPTNKIGALRIAGQMWADLLRPETGSGLGDALGLVKYNDTTQDYVGMQLMTAGFRGTINTAFDGGSISDPARLQPVNGTAIGGGMKRGADMILNNPLQPAGSPSRKHVMVVMTDGIETATPRVEDVLTGIKTSDTSLKIYSLGLGNDLDVGKLQSITTESPAHGFHQVSGDLTGTQRFDLQTFYFKILVDSLDWQLVVDPTYAVNLASTSAQVVSTAHVCSSDLSALFVVMDEPALRPYYDLSLVDPNNNVMSIGAAVGGVPVQIIERENYRILKVVFPDLALSSSYTGYWKLILVPNGKWQPRTPGNYTHGNVGGAVSTDPVFTGQNGLAPIGFGAAVASNYRLDANALASPYEPGSAITLTASLSDRQWPSVTGSVTVDATKPDGSLVNSITLYDDGTHGDVAASDGTWTAKFGQTALSGSYKFFFSAVGYNDRGELAPRQATRYVSLTKPPRDNPNGGGGRDDNNCLPCSLLQWLWRLVIALLVLILLLVLRRRP